MAILTRINRLFDEADRIQITDFGVIELEMYENETITGSDGFSEGWTAEADLGAFGSLLIEIMICQK
jgi:hypothetical protein